MKFLVVIFSQKNKMMILAAIGFLLFLRVSPSNLDVYCYPDQCPESCKGLACIYYQIQDVGYLFIKCAESCTGITSYTFYLQKCSGITDATNTKTCNNQCCYYHESQRRQVCLAPQAIGLGNNQYDDVCTRASRDLFREIDNMKIEMAVREKASSDSEERANNIAYAGLVVAIFGTVSGIILTIYFKCQKSETKEEKSPSNPETQRGKLESQNIQQPEKAVEKEVDRVKNNKNIQNRLNNFEAGKPNSPGTKIVKLLAKKKRQPERLVNPLQIDL